MHVHASKTYCRCKPIRNISLLMGLMFLFVGCHINDDDEEFYNPTNLNTNTSLTGTVPVTKSNGQVVTLGAVQGVTEGTTNITEVASRLEIPRLKGGQDNLFIVHTVPVYGVNYCIEWNYTLRAQRWSAFRWDRTNSVGYTGRTEAWSEDPLIPTQYRTTLADHSSNGHDRGHIMGSADRQMSVEANNQTFYLSNMQPQLSGFNSRRNESYGYSIWYNLENRLRNTYNTNTFRDTLYVVKGGTIDQNNYTWAQGRGQKLVVPKYFFMALLRKKNALKTQGGYDAVAFWMEHKENTSSKPDMQFKKYAVSIDRLEELTGIDFFCNLPDEIENKVENHVDYSIWYMN